MNVAFADQAQPDTRSTWMALGLSVLALLLLASWAVKHQPMLLPESLNLFKSRSAAIIERSAVEPLKIEPAKVEQLAVEQATVEQAPAEAVDLGVDVDDDIDIEVDVDVDVDANVPSQSAEQFGEYPLTISMPAIEAAVDVDQPIVQVEAVPIEDVTLAAGTADTTPIEISSAEIAAILATPDETTTVINATPEPSESPFEQLRREELAVLPTLSEKLVFEARIAQLQQNSIQPLDQLFELLFIYAETPVLITIDSAEFEQQNDNAALSQSRAEMLVEYLVERGLVRDRFEIAALGGQGIKQGAHRVSVQTSMDEP